MLGTTIGKYRIVGQLGRGGTGIVYRAVDETLGREVAIKILNPDLADSDIIKRFQVEATALAKLNHPGIATIYELFRSETDLLMVMELVRGETLEKLSARLGPMAPEGAVYLVDQLLSALEHAHHAGVVHRDIKPANVMVTSGGGVKIMDFGIARVRDAEHTTAQGRLVGTPAYMPPEQVLGETIDGRSDLYSVGVVFYRLLTGALPFSSDSSIGMLQRQVTDPPTPLAAHREGLPDWCETIVRRALEKSPADRFQTAEEFREALGRASGMMAAVDLAKSFGILETDAAPPPEAAGRKTVAIRRAGAAFRRRAVRVALMGSAIAVLVLAWLVLAYVRGPRPATAPATPVAPATTPPSPAAKAAPVPPANSPPPVAPPRVAAVPEPAETFPVLVFETRALVSAGSKQQERDAQLVLADGKVTVTAGDMPRPLHAVPYGGVISISYSRGRDPLWNSPRGPAPAARTSGGLLRKLGFSQERHWISLRTGRDRFIILRVNDTQVKNVLAALQKRTRRTPRYVELRKAPE